MIVINDVVKIKRYKNRKLYNTLTKQYVNNSALIAYLKAGTKFQVVNLENIDVTEATLRSLLSTASRNIPQDKVKELVVSYGDA